MSFGKMLFSHFLNNMSIVASLIRSLKNARIGATHSFCNYVTNTGQRLLYLDSSSSRKLMQNVNRVPMYKDETDSNDNSFNVP